MNRIAARAIADAIPANTRNTLVIGRLKEIQSETHLPDRLKLLGRLV
jgi:hypothetical protein